MQYRVLAHAFATICLCSPIAWGWSASGHEAVALVAWDQLSPTTRAKLTDILDHHPMRDHDLLRRIGPGEDRDVAMFITAATWPDIVKGYDDPMHYTENHPQWHYVDFPINDGVRGPQPDEKWDGRSDPQNLLQAMAKVMAEFSDPKTMPDRRAIDLCWIEHLVGDIHQPLHAASYFSPNFPQGDKGGNSYLTLLNGHVIALHGYWDGLEGRGAGETYVRRVVRRIEADHPPAEFTNKMLPGDVGAWARESLEIARHVVYVDGKLGGLSREQLRGGQAKPPAAPDDYDVVAHKTADERIALGGYRLAMLLDQLSATLPTTAPTPTTNPTSQK